MMSERMGRLSQVASRPRPARCSCRRCRGRSWTVRSRNGATMWRMPGEPRTGRGRASRERIVERAAELVAERGVEGTSLDEVLAAAGASKSQLYHYFAGRDELVEAAVARRCAQVLGELTQALGGLAT